MTDILTDETLDQDALDAQRLTEGLRKLRELRGEYDAATAELKAAREAGRRRVAALQDEINAENAELVRAVTATATAFNDAASDLVSTGFVAPRVLASKGLASIRVKK